MPIENSSIGPVLETSDLLRTTSLALRGMTALKIGHALLGQATHTKADRHLIKRVYSHEQVRTPLHPPSPPLPPSALSRGARPGPSDISRTEPCTFAEPVSCDLPLQGIGQCVGYLDKLYPQAEVVPVNSTAAAAIAVRDDAEPALAICSHKCAEVYGLQVVDTNIQDGGHCAWPPTSSPISRHPR